MSKINTSADIAQNPILPAALRLPIKKQFFDMIKSGVKLEEYREIKKYWISRLFKYPEIFEALNNCCIECKNRSDNGEGIVMCDVDKKERMGDELICNIGKFTWLDIYFKKFNRVEFINGYSKSSPRMVVECNGIRIGNTNPEWADGWDDKVLIISLGAVLYSS